MTVARGARIDGANEVMVYNFSTDRVTSPFAGAMEKLDVLTLHEGLSDLTPDGFLMFEETEGGRVVVLYPDGSLYAEFINRASNGKLYMMNWSRYVSAKDGDRIVEALSGVTCPRQ